jgi:L-2-hydroxycarboxylate dehydrogenase (NAD+)
MHGAITKDGEDDVKGKPSPRRADVPQHRQVADGLPSMTAEHVLFCAKALSEFVSDVFRRAGLSPEHAHQVAESMIQANLRGVDTHGVVRSGAYLDRVHARLVNPEPDLKAHGTYPWAVSIDADNAMGAVAAHYAMDLVLERAQSFGLGGATVKHSNHFGAASVYALRAAQSGCIGIVLSPASKSLAPFGSMEPMFGTNPIAMACPAGRNAPWAMDMATSVAARGHIRLAARRGEAIPQGWALDSQGQATTDAQAALKGVMLPFAGPKGSALAMMVDILGGVLSGSAFGGGIRDMNTDATAPQDVGHFFMAIKIDAFMPIEDFATRMDEEIRRLKALKPAAGFSDVKYPGEHEAFLADQRAENGIPIPSETLKVLHALAQQSGVDLPHPVPRKG